MYLFSQIEASKQAQRWGAPEKRHIYAKIYASKNIANAFSKKSLIATGYYLLQPLTQTLCGALCILSFKHHVASAYNVDLDF